MNPWGSLNSGIAKKEEMLQSIRSLSVCAMILILIPRDHTAQISLLPGVETVLANASDLSLTVQKLHTDGFEGNEVLSSTVLKKNHSKLVPFCKCTKNLFVHINSIGCIL